MQQRCSEPLQSPERIIPVPLGRQHDPPVAPDGLRFSLCRMSLPSLPLLSFACGHRRRTELRTSAGTTPSCGRVPPDGVRRRHAIASAGGTEPAAYGEAPRTQRRGRNASEPECTPRHRRQRGGAAGDGEPANQGTVAPRPEVVRHVTGGPLQPGSTMSCVSPASCPCRDADPWKAPSSPSFRRVERSSDVGVSPGCGHRTGAK